MKQPLYERQKALRQHFRKTTGFAFVSSIVLARYDEALIQNCLKGDRARWGRGAKLTGREEIAGSELSTTRLVVSHSAMNLEPEINSGSS
jgi:hypothetical protein